MWKLIFDQFLRVLEDEGFLTTGYVYDLVVVDFISRAGCKYNKKNNTPKTQPILLKGKSGAHPVNIRSKKQE